ncbi:protein of unknown function [Bradyrhizobium vignae]|uniref:Uncharacterized protein n=1 Tax=Bradyrhizobium vignae TaxID=1549949 RepID=A0A2U3Q8P4_9BRAD|nr:protein of unknown function [Bradyrhizobium vignae]
MNAPPMLSEPELVPVPLRVAEVGCVPDGVSLVPCAEATEIPMASARRRLNVLIILLNFPCSFLSGPPDHWSGHPRVGRPAGLSVKPYLSPCWLGSIAKPWPNSSLARIQASPDFTRAGCDCCDQPFRLRRSCLRARWRSPWRVISPLRPSFAASRRISSTS